MNKTEISKQAFDFLHEHNEGIPTPPVVFHYDSNIDTVEGGFAGERFGIYKA